MFYPPSNSLLSLPHTHPPSSATLFCFCFCEFENCKPQSWMHVVFFSSLSVLIILQGASILSKTISFLYTWALHVCSVFSCHRRTLDCSYLLWCLKAPSANAGAQPSLPVWTLVISCRHSEVFLMDRVAVLVVMFESPSYWFHTKCSRFVFLLLSCRESLCILDD